CRANQGVTYRPVMHIPYKDAKPTPPGPAGNCRRKPSGSRLRAAASRGPSSPGTTNRPWAAVVWPIPGTAVSGENLATDGYARTSPVGEFPANGYGLYDMIGNV